MADDGTGLTQAQRRVLALGAPKVQERKIAGIDRRSLAETEETLEQKLESSGMLNVDVNAPRHVNVSAAGKGLFDKTRTKSRDRAHGINDASPKISLCQNH
jgi:hypothetical protein